jgi:hypothetical protein
MKKVPIAYLYNGEFYSDGKKYKYEGSANTRFICHEIACPDNKIQFSAYSTVEVDDGEASKMLFFFMEDVLRRTRSGINDLERGIELLKSQDVKKLY